MLRPDGNFSLREAGGVSCFVHRSGREVRTDEAGKAIWESLPGDKAETNKRAMDRLGLDAGQTFQAGGGVIAVFIEVLVRAGIIVSDEKNSVADVARPEEKENTEGTGEPAVSVVVVTHNGSIHIDDCMGSLLAQNYPRLEIIVVDSGSTDGTPELIRKKYPVVRTISFAENIHFARAVNEGVKNSRGSHVFILNQDVEVGRDCVAALAGRFQKERARGLKTGAVVPLMKFFDLRGFVNGLGNHVSERGWGSDNFIGFVDVGQFGNLAEVPSACFGAVMLDRSAVEGVGLLDDEYTAFYEDVDWSYRCWMSGWRIVPESRAVVYHKFGASYPRKGKLKLVARNRLRLVLKLFRDRRRWKFLKCYVGEDGRNMASFIARREWSQMGAYIVAYASLLGQIPGILLKRRKILGPMRRSRPPDRTTKQIRDSDILAMNPAVFSALDDVGRPILDARMISTYYYPLYEKRGIVNLSPPFV
jgi:GT2 family glycosyltransferase